ncbi:MAG: putative holin-like toxin [Lactobacillaceae bacterium]|nr:putative holin-like toxin [Bombilactobacillus mellis]
MDETEYIIHINTLQLTLTFGNLIIALVTLIVELTRKK